MRLAVVMTVGKMIDKCILIGRTVVDLFEYLKTILDWNI